MKIAVSFLKSKCDKQKTLELIEKTDADYIHVDIMDGKFVPNVQLPIEECYSLIGQTTKKLDVHLMVEEPMEYIKALAMFNVEYFTIHIELGYTVDSIIEYIKSIGIGAGIALNPETSIDTLTPYLDKIDYIIVMGVTPGAGGQSILPETIEKVKKLKELRDDTNHYAICFDGGVNEETRKLLEDADVLVSGSFVCMSDNYQEKINKLR